MQVLDFHHFSKIPLFRILYKCLIFNAIIIFIDFRKITLVTVVNSWFSGDLQVSDLRRNFASVLWYGKLQGGRGRGRGAMVERFSLPTPK